MSEPNCSLCSQPAAGEFRFKDDDTYHWYCTGCLMARVARQTTMGSFHGRSIVGDDEEKRKMLRVAPELMPHKTPQPRHPIPHYSKENSCPNCGRKWSQHTGTYCEHCGESKETTKQ